MLVVVAAVVAVLGSVLSLAGALPLGEDTRSVDLAGKDLAVLPPAPVVPTPEEAPIPTVVPAEPTEAPPSTEPEKPREPERPKAQLPAQLLDLRNWYLTLPTGANEDPDTVQPSQLASYVSRFFRLNDTGDGVVFTANASGATTSGSKYPRSELREMFGSEKASWDGNSGTHTMELDQAITKTPSAKPDVIAGQIHDGADDVMQIHLSGRRLTVKYADGKKEVLLNDNYALGTRFRVKIQSAGGAVKVWYNGKLSADLPIASSSSYFKAGAYVNSNTEKGESGSAEGQVVIYSLRVTHT
jgi:hypothetical protein